MIARGEIILSYATNFDHSAHAEDFPSRSSPLMVLNEVIVRRSEDAETTLAAAYLHNEKTRTSFDILLKAIACAYLPIDLMCKVRGQYGTHIEMQHSEMSDGSQ